MKPNTAIITLDRLRELEDYEKAVNERLSVKIKADIITNKGHEEIKRQKEIIRCDNDIITCIAKVNQELKDKLKKLEEERLELLKNKCLTKYSDSELEKEVLYRFNNGCPEFNKLLCYATKNYVLKSLITTLSVWEFLRWKKKKKKESISFKLP